MMVQIKRIERIHSSNATYRRVDSISYDVVGSFHILLSSLFEENSKDNE
jgi:hypothetical protein